MTTEGMPEDDARRIFEEIDDSNTGRITMSKFLHYNVVASINSMQKHFKEMDDDKDRQITKDDFFTFFLRSNSESTTSKLWTKLDANANKKINFTEWKAWAEDVCAVQSIGEVFGGVLKDDE